MMFLFFVASYVSIDGNVEKKKVMWAITLRAQDDAEEQQKDLEKPRKSTGE